MALFGSVNRARIGAIDVACGVQLGESHVIRFLPRSRRGTWLLAGEPDKTITMNAFTRGSILRSVIASLTLLLIGGPAIPDDKPKTDKDKLQGRWRTVAGEFGGEAFVKSEISDQIFVFKGDVVITIQGDVTMSAVTYTLDETKKPKQFNFEVDNNGIRPAIYELKDDELRICMDVPGGTRPTEFKTKSGTRQKMWVLKREKK
jgi:uncharacterized protein (TIGR03067 family)